jgi:enoyl-CoA hydratase/carnithine racemase
VIAMIEDRVGGACEAAFACDLIVAAPATTFAVTDQTRRAYNVTA